MIFYRKLMIAGLVILLSFTVVAQKSKKRPNILFAICDDVSYLHTGYGGSPFVNTPTFNKIAQEGIYFSNFYVASPGCAPSRGSIVTGRYPWQNEQSGQHGSSWMKKYVPLADELQANGYKVGMTGKGVSPFRYAKNKSEETLWRKENAAGPEYNKIHYSKEHDERTTTKISSKNYFENFKTFMKDKKEHQPFFFWYGAHEAHRGYEKDSWKRTNKQLKDVTVPAFLPDNGVVRGDLLDYAVEIEWFDAQLQRMLTYLKSKGELENTIVIVTADNGMPFPRAKANCYDYGVHVPFAVSYPKEFQQNKTIKTPLGAVDLAPTILEMTQTIPTKMQSITGSSFLKVLKGEKELNTNNAVFSGRERHTSARYNNLGYPQRCIRKKEYLLIWNISPERWPAGAPVSYKSKEDKKLIKNVFADIDGSPTKSYILKNKEADEVSYYFDISCDKRPEFELYNLEKDSSCLTNLSGTKEYQHVEIALKQELMQELIKTKDPRVVGPNKEVFDNYKRYSSMRYFPKFN